MPDTIIPKPSPPSAFCGSAWAFSPIRREAVEREQAALAGFERIAPAMPTLARRKTAELLPVDAS